MNSTKPTWSSETGYSVAAVTLSLLFVCLFACLMFCKMRDRSSHHEQIILGRLHTEREESKESQGEKGQMIYTLDSENFETIELETSKIQKNPDPELVSDIEAVTMPKQVS